MTLQVGTACDRTSAARYLIGAVAASCLVPYRTGETQIYRVAHYQVLSVVRFYLR